MGLSYKISDPVDDEQQRARAHRANRRLVKTVVVVVVALFLVSAWAKGTFDYALVNVGLNAKPCAKNGFGATFGGDDLTQYQQRIKSIGQ
jgi:hypothetical protein